jgi:hypothetical protein
MKQIGNVNIPQEAFVQILKSSLRAHPKIYEPKKSKPVRKKGGRKKFCVLVLKFLPTETIFYLRKTKKS